MYNKNKDKNKKYIAKTIKVKKENLKMKNANIEFDKQLDKKIMDTFLLIGLSAHLQGYKYLKESIKLVMKEPDCINNVTKKLYPTIAKMFDTTPYRVERGIRHALDVSYTKGKLIKLNKLFGFEVLSKKDKPTNSEFVALMADKFNFDLK